MGNSLLGYFDQLKVNKFFSLCTKVNKGTVINFDNVNFSKPPKVILTSNRFVITYGDNGSIEKRSLVDLYEVSPEKIVFKDEIDENNPVCLLAIEHTEDDL